MKKKNALLAAAISGMMLGAAGAAQAATPNTGARNNSVHAKKVADNKKGGDKGAEKHACKGKNECKGKGGCKTDKHECKGKNTCKGQGGCATDGSKK